MRTFILIASAALVLTACSKPNGEAAASGEVTSASAMRLEMGGQALAIGQHKAEVRVFADGRVEALVVDAHGKAIAEPEKAKLTARSSQKTIDLAWDPVLARFAGKASGNLEATPIDLDLKIGEATAHGKLDAPVLLVGPEIGGSLFVAGKYGVELAPRVDGSVEAIVRNAAGVKVGADANLKIEANLAAAAGGTTKVVLAWDPPSARFVGKADASAKLAGGPAEISIDGNVAAKMPSVALAAPVVVANADAKVDANAKVDAKADAKVDAKAKADAKAKVDANAKVKAPEIKPVINKSASASAGNGAANAKAGFSLGTK